MGMDARRPVQYADYSLNDGKILDDAVTTDTGSCRARRDSRP